MGALVFCLRSVFSSLFAVKQKKKKKKITMRVIHRKYKSILAIILYTTPRDIHWHIAYFLERCFELVLVGSLAHVSQIISKYWL